MIKMCYFPYFFSYVQFDDFRCERVLKNICTVYCLWFCLVIIAVAIVVAVAVSVVAVAAVVVLLLLLLGMHILKNPNRTLSDVF